MERKSTNSHFWERIKLREDIKQKIIDRFSTYQADTRQRVDTLIKSIFVLSGGALTISIGVFLRHEAPKLAQRTTELLQYSWWLLFYSLVMAAFFLFIMIAHGYIVGELWNSAQKTGENKIDKSLLLKSFQIANWFFGITGFVSFVVGLAMLAFVSVSAIGQRPNITLNVTLAATAKLAH